MENNLSIIPGEAFTAAASVVNNVLDKMEHAVGFVVTPRGKKKDLEEAVSYYIDEIKNDQKLSPIIKAVISRNTLIKMILLILEWTIWTIMQKWKK